MYISRPGAEFLAWTSAVVIVCGAVTAWHCRGRHLVMKGRRLSSDGDTFGGGSGSTSSITSGLQTGTLMVVTPGGAGTSVSSTTMNADGSGCRRLLPSSSLRPKNKKVVTYARKNTLLLPGQYPATVSADVEGVVVVGESGASLSTYSSLVHHHNHGGNTASSERVSRWSGIRTVDSIIQQTDNTMTPGPPPLPPPLPLRLSLTARHSGWCGGGAPAKDQDMVPLPPSPPPRGHEVSEVRLDEIKLGHMIGRGAYGTVHYGEWRTRSHAKVAVKTLHAMTGVSKREVRTFMREVSVLSRLNHPGIVRLLGACLQLPHICIVEELMEGGSLHGFIHGSGEGGGGGGGGGDRGDGDYSRPGRQLTCAETLRVAHDVASAMAYLATQGVVHRDLKSHNVLLTSRFAEAHCLEDTAKHHRHRHHRKLLGRRENIEDVEDESRPLGVGSGLAGYMHEQEALRQRRGADGGIVWAKVADFGIAKARGHTIMTTTMGGGNGGEAGGGDQAAAPAGTPVYMAPELFRGVPGESSVGVGETAAAADAQLSAAAQLLAAAGEKCDVYSFGVLLWECITGRVPWGWMTNHMQVIFAVAVEGRRPPMPTAAECTVQELRDLVSDCWSDDAARRPTFRAVEERVSDMRRQFSELR